MTILTDDLVFWALTQKRDADLKRAVVCSWLPLDFATHIRTCICESKVPWEIKVSRVLPAGALEIRYTSGERDRETMDLFLCWHGRRDLPPVPPLPPYPAGAE